MSATARVKAAVSESAGVDTFLSSLAPTQGPSASRPISRSTTINGFFDYWLSLARPGGMPAATDFAPAAIPRWLPNVAIIELNSPTVTTYRLAGTAVVERMGHNPTGTNILELMPPERRVQASRDLYELVTRPCCFHMSYVNNYSSGRVARVESIYMPLRPPRGGKPRIVCMNEFDATLAFRENRRRTTIIADVDEITWLDVGHGTPGVSQPRP